MLTWTPYEIGGDHEPYRWTARVGHLILVVEGNGGGVAIPGDEQPPEPETFNWFVQLDDEDKADERALLCGNATTPYYAKRACRRAVERLIAAMNRDLGRPRGRR